MRTHLSCTWQMPACLHCRDGPLGCGACERTYRARGKCPPVFNVGTPGQEILQTPSCLRLANDQAYHLRTLGQIGPSGRNMTCLRVCSPDHRTFCVMLCEHVKVGHAWDGMVRKQRLQWFRWRVQCVGDWGDVGDVAQSPWDLRSTCFIFVCECLLQS